MNSPSVSVFMPVYNGERYLGATLESLLTQTFRDFEIVIVDDGSTDGTQNIAAACARKDERVRVVSHERNMGLSAARNSGWLHVSPQSHYIMNHDSDDISLPGKLDQLKRYLELNPQIAAVGSFCRYIDGAGRELHMPPVEWSPENIRRTFGELNSMAISATLVRRELYEAIAPFRAEFGGCDDYDFWARALVAGFELANIPEILHHIRLHESSMGATQSAEMAASAQSIANRYAESIGDGVASSIKNMILSKSRALRVHTRLQWNSLKGKS